VRGKGRQKRLEQHGYDGTYGSSLDTMHEGFLTHVKTLLSVGHDEYITANLPRRAI
jgi:hypothetical protein